MSAPLGPIRVLVIPAHQSLMQFRRVLWHPWRVPALLRRAAQQRLRPICAALPRLVWFHSPDPVGTTRVCGRIRDLRNLVLR